MAKSKKNKNKSKLNLTVREEQRNKLAVMLEELTFPDVAKRPAPWEQNTTFH